MKIIKTFLFLLIIVIFAFVTTITISATTITNSRFGGNTAKLRIYPNQQLTTSTRKIVMAGSFNLPPPVTNLPQTVVTNITDDLAAKRLTNQKDLATGFPSLNGRGKMQAARLSKIWNGGDTTTSASTNYLLANYASLAAALAAIEADGNPKAILEIAAPVTLTANRIIPENVRIKLHGSAYFTSTSAAALEIKNGQGMEANPSQHIFRGNLKVKFTGSYPVTVYPEWWGAEGDALLTSYTDDYAAIQAMFDSFRNAETAGQINPPIARGAKVFFSGKNYAITQTIQVNTTTDIELSPATFIIQKNGNLSAFRFNGLVTEDSYPTPVPRSAAHSYLHGSGSIVANGGANTHVVTGANTIFDSGTSNQRTEITLNRVSGAAWKEVVITDYSGANHLSLGYDEGYTVTFGGLTWIIKQRVSDDQVILYPFRLRPFVTSNNQELSIIIPDTMPQNLVGATVAIEGRLRIIDSITTTGSVKTLHLTAPHGITSTPVGDQLDAEIVRLPVANFTNENARFNINSGVDMRIGMDISDVTISGFSGHGIQADTARAPTTIPQTQPNTNNSTIRNVHVINNYGAGFYARGVNSNNMLIDSLDSQSNKIGIYDTSFLGNLYVKPHLALDEQGSFVGVSAVQGIQPYGSKVVYGYVEGGMPSVLLGATSIWEEGDAATGFATYYTGAINSTSGGVPANGFYNGRANINGLHDYIKISKPASGGATNSSSGNTVVIGSSRGNNINLPTSSFFGFGIDSDSISKSSNGISYSMGSYNPFAINTGIITLNYGPMQSQNPDYIPFYLTTSTTPIVTNSNSISNGGKIVFPNGLFVGLRNDQNAAANTLTKLTVNSNGFVAEKGLKANTLQVDSLGTRPVCASALRGMFWLVKGGAGVADKMQVCGKEAADSYTWKDFLSF